MGSRPIERNGQAGWAHDEGIAGVSFETFDHLDLDDPFGPRQLHVMVPDARASSLPVLFFQDGDTTFWPGGPAHATWDVARTYARLRTLDQIPPMLLVAIRPRDRNLEYTHVDWRASQAPWGGLDRYSAWLVRSLLPWIRQSYPEVTARREEVGVIGSSHGGLAAFRIATSYPETVGVGGCLSPSFFSGLDDLDRGPRPSPLEHSDLVVRARPALSDSARRPRLWIDWGLRRDGGPHNANVEALAAHRGREMAELLGLFGARVAWIGPTEVGPPGADVVVCIDPVGGHDERAWSHRAGLFLRTCFGR
jgi:hypothetical protein